MYPYCWAPEGNRGGDGNCYKHTLSWDAIDAYDPDGEPCDCKPRGCHVEPECLCTPDGCGDEDR